MTLLSWSLLCCIAASICILPQLSFGFRWPRGRYQHASEIGLCTHHHSRICSRNLKVTLGAKKKSNQGSSDGSSASGGGATSPPPMRVSSKINIPVKQQIAWAKAYKRLMSSNGCSNNLGKKFRQTKGPKEAEEEYVEIDYKTTKPPAVFVDGYNVIGFLNAVEGRKISMEDARDSLVSDLAVLRSATGWWIEVVFDAYKVASAQKTESVNSMLITYTSAAETADNFIERRFSELAAVGFTNMVVATDDSALRMVAGSVGAGYMSCGMLVEELRIAFRGWEDVSEELDKEVERSRPRIGDGLSDEVKTALEIMKLEAVREAEMKRAAAAEAGYDNDKSTNQRIRTGSELGDAAVAVSSSDVDVAPNTVARSAKLKKKGKSKHSDLLEGRERKADIEVFDRSHASFSRKPTIGDSLSGDLKRVLEQMKREAEAAEAAAAAKGGK